MSPDLTGPLLRDVSRSFYLTIRILPAALREPIGLAYLLARASDTIADTADAPAPVRLAHLAALGKMIAHGVGDALPELQRDITPPDPAERALIARLPDCLAALDALDEPARAEIRAVMEKIIRGQTLDLRRFPPRPGGGVIALQSAAELDEYTYLVAGCVGEFWTRLCFQRLPRYSRLDPAELTRLGIRYGQGLQLVNILRDLPADLRAGRCYLPADELHVSPAMLLSDPESARPVFARWHGIAEAHLEAGRRYIAALRPARLRAGCFLPWHLGRATLALLKKRPPLETPERVKVPRSAVRRTLLLAPLAAFSDAPLRPGH